MEMVVKFVGKFDVVVYICDLFVFVFFVGGFDLGYIV